MQFASIVLASVVAVTLVTAADALRASDKQKAHDFVARAKAMDLRKAMRAKHFAAVESGEEDDRIAALTADWTEDDFVRYGETQLNALRDFYDAMDGPAWVNATGWSEANNTSPCGNRTSPLWYGLKCSGTIVTTLSLDANGLGGLLPASIGDLTYLRFISLQHNSLIGPVPATIGNLTTLSQLDVDGNGLSGPLPAALDSLAELELAYFGANNFGGPLPALTNCQSLQYLELASNAFTGSIPASYAALPLVVFNAAFNALNGMFPVGLCRSGLVCTAYGNRLSCPSQACSQCGLPTCNCQYHTCQTSNDCAGGLCATCNGSTCV